MAVMADGGCATFLFVGRYQSPAGGRPQTCRSDTLFSIEVDLKMKVAKKSNAIIRSNSPKAQQAGRASPQFKLLGTTQTT